MITYEEMISELMELRDEKYRIFNERIANIEAGTSIGVRVPDLRAYAKRLICRDGFEWETLYSYENAFFEVRIIKCLCAAYMKSSFCDLQMRIRQCVELLDSWAVCDIFCATLKQLKKVREDYVCELLLFAHCNDEFTQRFAFVILLEYYMDAEYLDLIFDLLKLANPDFYYAKMGAAWLLAEVIVRFYDRGVRYIRETDLVAPIVNRAIQKACESYRLDDLQKKSIKSLKK